MQKKYFKLTYLPYVFSDRYRKQTIIFSKPKPEKVNVPTKHLNPLPVPSIENGSTSYDYYLLRRAAAQNQLKYTNKKILLFCLLHKDIIMWCLTSKMNKHIIFWKYYLFKNMFLGKLLLYHMW